MDVYSGIERMQPDAGDALVDDLHGHNPWWEDGTAAFSLPSRQKSDFYHLARPEESGSKFEDQRVLGLVGRRGVGKTTLLKQFIHHRIEDGDAPEQFLYLPFDADPLYQLRSADQLYRAVRYYENRVLGRVEDATPQFVFVDDVHWIEHPHKPNSDGWGVPVARLLEDSPGRHVVVTASAGVQVERELERRGVSQDAYAIQPVLPEKFRDYLYTLYPDLEADGTRVSPTPVRSGPGSLPAAMRTGELEPFVTGVRDQYERVADDRRRIQSQVVEYLSMGGIISYAQSGAVESASELADAAYSRLREEVRDALYQQVPGFETIQTIADLERLCALAARNRATEPIRYQELVELFDVDRRTVADSYLPALEQLYLLTGVTEYRNSRPRSVRLYLRDTGLVTALADREPAKARNQYSRERDLARIAAFDHVMRFAHNVCMAQDVPTAGDVQYWRGRKGVVDFVFEVAGDPVPIGLAYQSREYEETRAAVREFLGEFGGSVGLVLTSDIVGGAEPIERIDDDVVELPYWLFLLLC